MNSLSLAGNVFPSNHVVLASSPEMVLWLSNSFFDRHRLFILDFLGLQSFDDFLLAELLHWVCWSATEHHLNGIDSLSDLISSNFYQLGIPLN